ncbi:MAG: autophagy protein 5 [Cirrosporium novae-zelandiae]|nr:MAG: autophagy protein 5 [Cirrosporium novae-zelandiae]
MSLPPSIQKIRQRIWEGSLPLEIVLSPTECRIFDKSDPYLVHFPRLSYLPFLLERLHNFFTPFLIDPSASEPHKGWFSFEDVPLKWHCPVGLLYDLFSGAEPVMLHRDDKGGGYGSVHESQLRPVKEEEEGNDGEGEEGGGVGAEEGGTKLPWKLTVHFSDWPEDQLVRLDTDWKALHDAFVNSAKEADFVRNGTARGIMSLSAEESKKLWRSVVELLRADYETDIQDLDSCR